MTRDTSSPTSSKPFAYYDPSTLSWRTSQDSYDADSTVFSGRWPKSGMTLFGRAYELPTLAHPTVVSESSSSPLMGTPQARDSKGPPSPKYNSKNLVKDVMLLPTPAANDSGNTPEDHLRKKPGRSVVTSLAIITENNLLSAGGRITPPSPDGNERLGVQLPLPLNLEQKANPSSAPGSLNG